MVVTEAELQELIKEPNADIEKITSLSSDGKNLLTRVPKEIAEFLRLNKVNKFRWLVKSDSKEIKIEVV